MRIALETGGGNGTPSTELLKQAPALCVSLAATITGIITIIRRIVLTN